MGIQIFCLLKGKMFSPPKNLKSSIANSMRSFEMYSLGYFRFRSSLSLCVSCGQYIYIYVPNQHHYHSLIESSTFSLSHLQTRTYSLTHTYTNIHTHTYITHCFTHMLSLHLLISSLHPFSLDFCSSQK